MFSKHHFGDMTEVMCTRQVHVTATAVEVCRTLKGAGMDIRRKPGTQLANDRTGEVIYTPPEGENRLQTLLANWSGSYSEKSGSSHCQRIKSLHLTEFIMQPGLRMPQVKLGLHVQPELCAIAQQRSQPQRHLG